MDAEALKLLGKFIGAGLASVGMGAAAIGVGLIFAAAINGMARNPAQADNLKPFAFVAMAFAEFMGIVAIAVAMLLLFAIK